MEKKTSYMYTPAHTMLECVIMHDCFQEFIINLMPVCLKTLNRLSFADILYSLTKLV